MSDSDQAITKDIAAGTIFGQEEQIDSGFTILNERQIQLPETVEMTHLLGQLFGYGWSDENDTITNVYHNHNEVVSVAGRVITLKLDDYRKSNGHVAVRLLFKRDTIDIQDASEFWRAER